MDPEIITGWLDDRRSEGIAGNTINTHIYRVKQFAEWCEETGRIMVSPLRSLKPVKGERIYQRRTLTDDEFATLIEGTKRACSRWRMSGPERALVYWFARHTGFRRSEIASLTAGSFNLNTDRPTVHLEASATKNRKPFTASLDPALAQQLRIYLLTKAPGAKAFPLTSRTAEMLEADLETRACPGWMMTAGTSTPIPCGGRPPLISSAEASIRWPQSIG